MKVQTYTADSLTLASDRPQFVIGPGTPWSGRRLHDLYAEAAMPWEWYPELADLAAEVGIELFSSPFDASAVDVALPLQITIARCSRGYMLRRQNEF